MIEIKPSNVHQGHYVYIDNISTGIVVNLYAYETIDDYKKYVDEQIEQFKKKV
jgi:hypothetical protein